MGWAWPASVAAAGAVLGLLAGLHPALAVAASLSLIFVMVVLADLTAGLVLFTFLSFLALIPSSGGPALSFLKLAGLLLAISWLATIASRQDARLDFASVYPAFTFVLVLFLTWAGISQIWAEDPAAANTSLSRYALNIILFLIIFTAVRERRHAVWVAAALLVGATFAAVYGLLVQPPEADSLDRLSGTIGNPNELAAALVVGLALSFGLAANAPRSPLLRLGAITAGTLCLTGVFLTASRAGLVALAAAAVAAVLISGRWRVAATAVAIVLAFATIGYFTAAASPETQERITSVESVGRTDLWGVGRRMVEDKPALGVGAGNFQVSSIHYLLEPGAVERDEFIVDDPKVAHNTYLEVLAELGVVGLALFVAILVFSFGCASKALRIFSGAGDRRMELLTRSVMVALIGLLTADIFNSGQYHKELWLLLGLCPPLLAIARSDGGAQATGGARPGRA